MYASTQRRPETKKAERQDQADVNLQVDPSLLRAARQIYRTFYEVHPDYRELPIGAAIHKKSCRGKLIFGSKPILLPDECFIPLNQIEASDAFYRHNSN